MKKTRPNSLMPGAARPAGVPPRRQGALFDPLGGVIVARSIKSSRRRSSEYIDGTSSFDISDMPWQPPQSQLPTRG